MSNDIRIAVDVFGGDNSPDAVIKGCIDALDSCDGFTLLLCGDEKIIDEKLTDEEYDTGRVEIIDAPEIISCNEQPTSAIRKKKNSSLVKAMEAVASGDAQAVLSAGSTGAIIACATFIVKRISGIKRPAIAPLLPTITGENVLLIDGGANVDCKSQYLEDFAMMGSCYMRSVMGIESPRVGLVSNGAEEEKGNELTKETYALLKTAPVNFVGSCEPRDVLSGNFDVVVCDGFVGNAILKTLEGTVKAIMTELKKSLTSSLKSKLGASLVKSALYTMKKRFDYKEHGGAPLLGSKGTIIKAHGSSDAKAFKNAILQTYKCALADIPERISEEIIKLPKVGDEQ